MQSTSNPKNSHGLWDKSEHDKYIGSLYIYNCDWSQMSKYMGNRTHYQIVSHSQKFFLRLKNFKDDELGLDFTSDFVNSLKQIVYMVKEKEESLNMNNKLLYIISEKISDYQVSTPTSTVNTNPWREKIDSEIEKKEYSYSEIAELAEKNPTAYATIASKAEKGEIKILND